MNAPKPALLPATDAYARMPADAAAETLTYVLGVQAVIWGVHWVKAGESFRSMTAPLPEGQPRSPFDPDPHGVNVWGHATKLLTADFRIIETPNTETLYSAAILDLADGPMVVVHPDFGERYFRTSVWQLHGDTDTISQKKDGGAPPPYAIVPIGWTGQLPDGCKRNRRPITLRPAFPTRRGLRR
jgi:hypothetical protein